MRLFFKKLFVFTLLISVRFIVTAQDQRWIMSNELLTINSNGSSSTPLPQPSVTQGDIWRVYHGQVAQSAQNIVFDDQGNIIFFIIDNGIYDKEGYAIISPTPNSSNSGYQIFSSNGPISVVKVPNECDKYYIIGSKLDPGNAVYFYFNYLDLSSPNILWPNTNKRGKIWEISDLQISGALTAYFNQNFGGNFSPAGISLIDDWGTDCPIPIIPHQIATDHFGSTNQMDVYDNNINGDKYLALTSGQVNVIYKITNQGFIYQTYVDIINTIYDAIGSAENNIEMFESNGVPKSVRCYSRDGNSNQASGIGQIQVDSYNSSFTSVINSQDYAINTEGISNAVCQVEPSENGQYIYFNTSTGLPHFGYIALASNMVFSLDSNFPLGYDLNNLKHAQMELGNFNGQKAIFIATSQGLNILTNSNNPNSQILVNQYPASFASTFNFDGINSLNLLRNQNYKDTQSAALLSENCCIQLQNNVAWNETHFNSTGSWQNGFNPFQNSAGPVYISGDLVFEAGSNVTISGMEFRFGPNAHVIIKQGAKVNLNNSKWTSYTCDGIMWPGVQIWGHGNLAQTDANQGNLNLNSSIIEFSIIGVEVGIPAQFSGIAVASLNPDSSGGGILRGVSAVFHNNAKDVLFHKYAKSSNGVYLLNQSNFNTCVFKTDDLIKDPSLVYSNELSLYLDYNQIQLKNCSFINYTPLTMHPYGQRRMGVYSVCSKISIIGNNNAFSGFSGDVMNTTFYSLDCGISVVGLGGLTTYLSCKNMEFQRCVTGIQNYFSDNSVLTGNNFEIPDVTYINQAGTFSGLGIGLKGSTQYKVKNNLLLGVNFPMISQPNPHGRGIVVQSSGDLNNYISDNNFNFLKKGIEVQLNNGNPELKTGLQLLCNHFNNCYTDIQRNANTTMRNSQGSSDQTAGNVFSHASSGSGYFDFFTNSNNNQPLTYEAYNVPLEVPDYNPILSGIGTALAVNLHPISSSACETVNSQNSHMPLTGHSLAEIKQRVIDAQDFYTAVIDGSLTAETKDLLKNADSNESFYLKTLLSERFPLSNEVMKEMIVQGEKLNPIHLTEVLLQNAPISKDVHLFLEESSLLSSNLLSIINNANQGISYSKQLENEIIYAAEDLQYFTDSLYDISSIYLGDSLIGADFTNYVSEISILIEDLYFENTVAMNSWFNTDLSITIGTLNSSELAAFYSALNNHLIEFDSLLVNSDSLSVSSYIINNIPDSVYKNYFFGLLFNHYGSSSEMYEEEIMATRSLEIVSPSLSQGEKISFFTASPNPNDGNFNVLLSSKMSSEPCWIQITNNMGQVIAGDHFVRSAIENFSFKNLPSGIYFISLYNKLGLIDSQMIVIEKND